jgi:hypothetical protein
MHSTPTDFPLGSQAFTMIFSDLATFPESGGNFL